MDCGDTDMTKRLKSREREGKKEERTDIQLMYLERESKSKGGREVRGVVELLSCPIIQFPLNIFVHFLLSISFNF